MACVLHGAYCVSVLKVWATRNIYMVFAEMKHILMLLYQLAALFCRLERNFVCRKPFVVSRRPFVIGRRPFVVSRGAFVAGRGPYLYGRMLRLVHWRNFKPNGLEMQIHLPCDLSGSIQWPVVDYSWFLRSSHPVHWRLEFRGKWPNNRPRRVWFQ